MFYFLLHREDQIQNYDPGRTFYNHSPCHIVFCHFIAGHIIQHNIYNIILLA